MGVCARVVHRKGLGGKHTEAENRIGSKHCLLQINFKYHSLSIIHHSFGTVSFDDPKLPKEASLAGQQATRISLSLSFQCSDDKHTSPCLTFFTWVWSSNSGLQVHGRACCQLSPCTILVLQSLDTDFQVHIQNTCVESWPPTQWHYITP